MTYRQLHGKYLRDAERLARKKDRVQASEKYWGATAVLLKDIGRSRGVRYQDHRSLQLIINQLYKDTKDPDLPRDFDMAQALHANFYEDFMDGAVFRLHADRVKILLDKLQKLNGEK